MKTPENLRYSKEHEWISREENTAAVGITQYAQKELGDVVFVELPQVGQTLEAGEAFGTVESVKAVSEVYAPVKGKVEEINETLLDAPEKINEDPYGEGWLIRISIEDTSQLETLMSDQQYRDYLAEESN